MAGKLEPTFVEIPTMLCLALIVLLFVAIAHNQTR